MRAAKTDNLNNAERDLHRLFRDEGLCLPISATIAQVETQTLHYLSLQTWFPYLMSRQPALLLGGFQRKGSNAELLLSTFWKKINPMHLIMLFLIYMVEGIAYQHVFLSFFTWMKGRGFASLLSL